MDGQGIIRQRGVTLIELLVVMAILALAASVIVLNAPPARSLAKEESERFAARLGAAWEDSVIQGKAMSVAVGARGYRIERYVGGQWKEEVSGRRFASRTVPEGVVLLATVEDPAAGNEKKTADAEEVRETRIILDPIGLTTPFKVEFRDRRESWIVRNLPDETIMVSHDE